MRRLFAWWRNRPPIFEVHHDDGRVGWLWWRDGEGFAG